MNQRIKNRVRTVVLSLFAMSALVMLSDYARADIYKDCAKSYDKKKRIFACNRIIKKGGRNKKRLGDAHRNRGIAIFKDYDLDDKDRYGKAFEDFNKSIKYNPRDAEAYFQRSRVHVARDEDEKAIKDITKALSLLSKKSRNYKRSAYKYTGLRALDYVRIKNYDAALKDANAQIRMAPKMGGGHATRATIFRESGQPEKAVVELKKAINSKSWKLFRGLQAQRLAELYEEMGKTDLAIDTWNKIVAMRKKEGDVGVLDHTIDEALQRLKNKKVGKDVTLKAVVVIHSGKSGRVYDRIGETLCKIVKQESEGSIDCLSSGSDGSQDNLRKVRQSGVDFAIVRADHQHEAYKGVGAFAKVGAHESLRAVLSFHRAKNGVTADKDKGAILVTGSRAEDDVVKTIVSVSIKHIEKLKQANPLALGSLAKEHMATSGLSAPLHPAAKKAFEAQGILK